MSESGKEREHCTILTADCITHIIYTCTYIPALWSQPVSQCFHRRRVGRPPIAPCDGLEGSSGRRWTHGSLALRWSSASEGAEGGGRVRERRREGERKGEREREGQRGREGGRERGRGEGGSERRDREGEIHKYTHPLTHIPHTHSPTPPLTQSLTLHSPPLTLLLVLSTTR